MSRYRQFRLWLSQFNPVAVWREEKRLDREAQLLMVTEIASAMRDQSAVATKALDLTAMFMQSFQVQGEPTTYVSRPEDEVRAAAERMGIKLDEFDEDPFSYY